MTKGKTLILFFNPGGNRPLVIYDKRAEIIQTNKMGWLWRCTAADLILTLRKRFVKADSAFCHTGRL